MGSGSEGGTWAVRCCGLAGGGGGGGGRLPPGHQKAEEGPHSFNVFLVAGGLMLRARSVHWPDRELRRYITWGEASRVSKPTRCAYRQFVLDVRRLGASGCTTLPEFYKSGKELTSSIEPLLLFLYV